MKRFVLIAAGCLLVGAVVNVGVAWGGAAWHYAGDAPRNHGAALVIDLAFEVFVRAGEREWPVGRIDSEREHAWDFSGWFGGSGPGLTATRADLLLRPNAAAARRTLSIDRIWSGEIVLEGIWLEWENDRRRAPSPR